MGMIRIMILITGVMWLTGCRSNSDTLLLRVDMAGERDEGRFTPSSGDRLSLAADFTDWEAGELFLEDENGDWIYTTTLPANVFANSDTLFFKFVVVNEGNRDLPNSGWEVIPNRQVTRQVLEQEQPVFVFNEAWSPLVEKELSFRVNMANQQVLGFFDPEAGDQVAVTGSFLKTDPAKSDREEEGIELTPAETPLVYQVRFPVEVREQEPVLYQYRIIPGEERKEAAILPNRGLETSGPRRYREEPTTDYFNDQTRILLVEVSGEWLAQRTQLSPDDVLHLKLSWNGTQSRNYRLEANGNGSFETAVQVPESAADLEGEVMLNYEEEFYEIDEINVGMGGKKFIIE